MTADTRPNHSGSRRLCRRTLLLFLSVLLTLSVLLSVGLLPANGVSLYQVSKDGTKYTVGASQTAVASINAWQKAFGSRGVRVMFSAEAPAYKDLNSTFDDGDVLFATGFQLFQLETSEMKGMEDQKCLIPYPKLQAKDPYYVFTHDNARVGGILKTTSKFEEVSAWVQASSVSSSKILDEYYNVALKYKNGVDYGSTKMLDIVYDSICNPKYIVDGAILSVTNNSFKSDDDRPTHFSRATRDKANTYSSKYQSAPERRYTFAQYHAASSAPETHRWRNRLRQ